MISIVIPCYNCEKTIEATVKSVSSQSYPEYEIILVDDGSSDKTSELCDEYAREDNRIRVVHQDNKGLMRAWKNGVLASTGDYILFCDADDYVDNNLVEKVSDAIRSSDPDLILYGMINEFSNGEKHQTTNKLSAGYYDKKQIVDDVLPCMFSDGTMQSEVVLKSRCSKGFRKELLLRIMDDLPDYISFSEDDITTFASMVNAESIYCMGDYCPYHYVRNAESMIGQYDPKVFDKIDLVYGELEKLADKYNYTYRDQILHDRLSITLLFMKKEITRNPNGRRAVVTVLNDVRNSAGFLECLKYCSVDGYSLFSRLFAIFMINRHFTIAYYMLKVFEAIRGRNT